MDLLYVESVDRTGKSTSDQPIIAVETETDESTSDQPMETDEPTSGRTECLAIATMRPSDNLSGSKHYATAK